jgi:hypothetical protein
MPNDFDNDDRLQMTEKPPKKIQYANDIVATAQEYQSVPLNNTFTTHQK